MTTLKSQAQRLARSYELWQEAKERYDRLAKAFGKRANRQRAKLGLGFELLADKTRTTSNHLRQCLCASGKSRLAPDLALRIGVALDEAELNPRT